jgi:hypothetical protein
MTLTSGCMLTTKVLLTLLIAMSRSDSKGPSFAAAAACAAAVFALATPATPAPMPCPARIKLAAVPNSLMHYWTLVTSMFMQCAQYYCM